MFTSVKKLSLFGIVISSALNGVLAWERLDKNKAALLVIDHQIGLMQLARDYPLGLYKNSVLAHAEIGKVFDLPVVMTTSAETGPNGPLPREILEMHSKAPLIKRNGEVNAWDNADFRAAVEATGRKQLIIAGITTDVCIEFLARSLLDAGYTVFTNSEASGTFNERVGREALDRVAQSGGYIYSTFSIICDLMRDWRSKPGAAEVFPMIDKYIPEYAFTARAHFAALSNGTAVPGEAEL